jgi:hypothetical protein
MRKWSLCVTIAFIVFITFAGSTIATANTNQSEPIILVLRPILRVVYDTTHKRPLTKISQEITVFQTPPSGTVLIVGLYKWGPENKGKTEAELYNGCGNKWKAECRWRITQWWEPHETQIKHFNSICTSGEYYLQDALYIPDAGFEISYWPQNPEHINEPPDRKGSWHIIKCPKKGQTPPS